MDFLLDENMPLSSIETISKLGYSVEHIRNIMRGADDKKVSKHAKDKDAILITKDLEFASTKIYPKGSHNGLIILRLPVNFNTNQICSVLKKFLTEKTNFKDKIYVVELGRYRIRDL